MITLAIYAAVLLGLGVSIAEQLRWRQAANDLNEENLALAQRVEVLERALSPKPRIEFGPDISKPATDSEWPDLLFQETRVKARPLPGSLRNVVPFQRKAGNRS